MNKREPRTRVMSKSARRFNEEHEKEKAKAAAQKIAEIRERFLSCPPGTLVKQFASGFSIADQNTAGLHLLISWKRHTPDSRGGPGGGHYSRNSHQPGCFDELLIGDPRQYWALLMRCDTLTLNWVSLHEIAPFSEYRICSYQALPS